MDVTLKVNGLDLHKILSTYEVNYESAYQKVITTLEGKEIAFPFKPRPIISFSLWPLDDNQSEELFAALEKMIFQVEFTNPHRNAVETKTFRLTSDIGSVFGLTSINGMHYYKGGGIELRAN